MAYRDEWDNRSDDGGSWLLGGGMGALRVALLFGAAAVALALVIAPIAQTQTTNFIYSQYGRSDRASLDYLPTGTVGQRDAGSYTIRRSVLQPSPTSVCIIRGNGMRTGDC